MTQAVGALNPYNLFVYPYKEGLQHFREFPKSPLSGRVQHAAIGLFLLIPLINTIVHLILQALHAHAKNSSALPLSPTSLPVIIFNDAPHAIETRVPEEPPEAIQKLNRERRELVEQYIPDQTPETVDQLKDLYQEAVETIDILHTADIQTYLNLSARRHQRLINLDGRIRGAKYNRAVPKLNGQRVAAFMQVGGVHQYQGSNHLCGYFALFYMYQAVSRRRQFANRDAFHPMLERWAGMIAKKHALTYLKGDYSKEIPAKLRVSVRGISLGEIQYLIENDPELECLRTTPNCFYLGMDDYKLQHTEKKLWNQQQRNGNIPKTDPYPVNVIQPLGNKVLNYEFPLYFIMKGMNMHYYLVWAETPWEFKVVHSLGSSIHNDRFFNEDWFFDIVDCLHAWRAPSSVTSETAGRAR